MSGPSEIVLETILKRRSVRNFTAQMLDPSLLMTLMKAAMAAPSARNRQPWVFLAITERSVMDSLAEGLPYTKMLFKAGAAIVVCGDSTIELQPGATDLWYQDAAAASQNILLQAYAMGLGAVWSALYPYEDRSAHVRKILDLPAHISPFSIIPLGYPTGEDLPKDKFKPERIHWEKW
ncbi:MAG: nitroreductase family protein [Bacteroidetes bacterium]|nr:nitroreductase family protein [Bacteroidota bacterium]